MWIWACSVLRPFDFAQGKVVCSVIYVFTCIPVCLLCVAWSVHSASLRDDMFCLGVLVEGCEVFDAEDGFGADLNALDGCGLRCWESYGRCEGVKVDELTVDVGEFPVSREMNIGWVGDEIQFAQEVFVAK